MRGLALGVVLLWLLGGCASHPRHERDYQEVFCERIGGETEVALADRTRVDCVNERYAVEVDFARKWAEGIGQSLYYAQQTGRQPAVALIMDEGETRYLKRLEAVARQYDIKIFIIDKE